MWRARELHNPLDKRVVRARYIKLRSVAQRFHPAAVPHSCNTMGFQHCYAGAEHTARSFAASATNTSYAYSSSHHAVHCSYSVATCRCIYGKVEHALQPHTLVSASNLLFNGPLAIVIIVLCRIVCHLLEVRPGRPRHAVAHLYAADALPHLDNLAHACALHALIMYFLLEIECLIMTGTYAGQPSQYHRCTTGHLHFAGVERRRLGKRQLIVCSNTFSGPSGPDPPRRAPPEAWAAGSLCACPARWGRCAQA